MFCRISSTAYVLLPRTRTGRLRQRGGEGSRGAAPASETVSAIFITSANRVPGGAAWRMPLPPRKASSSAKNTRCASGRRSVGPTIRPTRSAKTATLLVLGPMLMFGSERARGGLKWVSATLAATALLGVAAKVLPMFNKQETENLISLVLPLSLARALPFARHRLRWFAHRLRCRAETMQHSHARDGWHNDLRGDTS